MWHIEGWLLFQNPAHAGMNLRRESWRPAPSAKPRSRGDEPVLDPAKHKKSVKTPLTRG